jgi:hypothetical protein
MSPDDYPSAARSFRAVFHVFDPYGSPFQPAVPARLIVYAYPAEANPWGLNDADLDSLVAAADDRDLERVFVSLADPEHSEPDEGHYVLRPLSVESYTRTHPREAWPIVPHAIYPPSGHWGVISSDESHVLVGGSRRFIDDLQGRLGAKPGRDGRRVARGVVGSPGSRPRRRIAHRRLDPRSAGARRGIRARGGAAQRVAVAPLGSTAALARADDLQAGLGRSQ